MIILGTLMSLADRRLHDITRIKTSEENGPNYQPIALISLYGYEVRIIRASQAMRVSLLTLETRAIRMVTRRPASSPQEQPFMNHTLIGTAASGVRW